MQGTHRTFQGRTSLMIIMAVWKVLVLYMQEQTVTASIHCSTELTWKLSRKMNIIMISQVSHHFPTEGTSASHITSNHTLKNFSLAAMSKLWNKRNSYYAHHGIVIEINEGHWLLSELYVINKHKNIRHNIYIIDVNVTSFHCFHWENSSPSSVQCHNNKVTNSLIISLGMAPCQEINILLQIQRSLFSSPFPFSSSCYDLVVLPVLFCSVVLVLHLLVLFLLLPLLQRRNACT
jgi:hypothetical protein